MTERRPQVEYYDAQYGNFATRLYGEIRAEAFGEDIGQNSWLTAEEHDLFLGWLVAGRGSTLLDVACGSGGPTLRLARRTGATVEGVDAHAQGNQEASRRAVEEGLADRVTFRQGDATRPLPLAAGSLDGLLCIDAINHLPDRPAVLAEWARLLRPGGHLVFTDPIVVTGPLSSEEIAIRSSIGFFLFVPRGTDEALLARAGFGLEEVADRTDNMARNAAGWARARAARAAELRRIEGDATFEGQQRFLEVAARLAAERRLSRFAFHAVKARG
jgi:SAM-dependent methyltransferase